MESFFLYQQLVSKTGLQSRIKMFCSNIVTQFNDFRWTVCAISFLSFFQHIFLYFLLDMQSSWNLKISMVCNVNTFRHLSTHWREPKRKKNEKIFWSILHEMRSTVSSNKSIQLKVELMLKCLARQTDRQGNVHRPPSLHAIKNNNPYTLWTMHGVGRFFVVHFVSFHFFSFSFISMSFNLKMELL